MENYQKKLIEDECGYWTTDCTQTGNIAVSYKYFSSLAMLKMLHGFLFKTQILPLFVKKCYDQTVD